MSQKDQEQDWPKQDMESGTLTALAHLYRAEVFRSTHWRPTPETRITPSSTAPVFTVRSRPFV